MTRAQIKALAREQLGGGIFKSPWLMALAACAISSILIGAAGSILWGLASLIVTGPLGYGLAYILLKQARDRQPIQLGDLFKGFSTDFKNTFLLGLMMGIFIALWSMLFVIPGIVMSYAYSMAYYIKLDHPEYTWKECLNQSKAMMKGYKMTLFVQDLSFIGWFIVGSLCFGVGTLWVVPYQAAARAQFYNALVGWQPQYVDPYAQQVNG